MLPFDAIHWWQQPTELDGNRLLRDYTDRNSLGTMPVNIPGASLAIERSTSRPFLRIARVKLTIYVTVRRNSLGAATD
jgi:hypothetical protein